MRWQYRVLVLVGLWATAATLVGADFPAYDGTVERDACWAFYDSQGWLKSNGRVISGDPRSLLTSWQTMQSSRGGNGGGEVREKINPVNVR
jgi:hypothetical protein